MLALQISFGYEGCDNGMQGPFGNSGLPGQIGKKIYLFRDYTPFPEYPEPVQSDYAAFLLPSLPPSVEYTI